MTLIVAGYINPYNLTGAEGLYIASDSVITTPRSNDRAKPLLKGFRKVYPVPIKIWKPYFLEPYFHSYMNTYYESECFVAIAGNTLVAQHVLNTITEHLANIRIGIEKEVPFHERGRDRKYLLLMDCEDNYLRDSPSSSTWDETMFLPSHFDPLITEEAIIRIIQHSIDVALRSAREYRLDAEDYEMMRTDFIVGIYSPVSQAHGLYKFTMKDRENEDGTISPYTEKHVLSKNEIAVIGMSSRFEDQANQDLQICLSSNILPMESMYKFLNYSIDEVCAETRRLIDYPSLLRVFDRGRLKKIQIKKGSLDNPMNL